MPIISNLYNLDALFPTYTSSDVGKMLAVNSSGTGYELVDAPERMPPGGTAGQVLSKTEDGAAWTDPPSGGVQPDWDQNDPTAADYVRNRLCYKDDPTTQVLVHGQFDVDTEDGVEIPSLELTTFGEQFNVVFDEITYECESYWNNGSIVIGDVLFGDYSTYPFVIEILSDVCFLYASTLGAHSLSVSKTVQTIHTMPREYLPVCTTNELGATSVEHMRDALVTESVHLIIGSTIYGELRNSVGAKLIARNVIFNGVYYYCYDTSFSKSVSQSFAKLSAFDKIGLSFCTLQLTFNGTSDTATLSGVDIVGATNVLPPVTTSDDGKLLQVVNGEWAAVDIGSAVELLAETGVAEPVTDGSAILTDANGIIYVL